MATTATRGATKCGGCGRRIAIEARCFVDLDADAVYCSPVCQTAGQGAKQEYVRRLRAIEFELAELFTLIGRRLATRAGSALYSRIYAQWVAVGRLIHDVDQPAPFRW